MDSRRHNRIASTVQIEMTRVLLHIVSECCDTISELQNLTRDNQTGVNVLKKFDGCEQRSIH